MTVLVPVEMPAGLGLSLTLISTGEAVLFPSHGHKTTHETVADGISYFVDGEGVILWREGAGKTEHEYDFGTSYVVNDEPMLKGWLQQLNLQNPLQM